MTIDAVETVTVHILGKDYKLSCPPDERDGLMQAAKLLDERTREIRNAGVIGAERIAVMAALYLGYELLQSRSAVKQDAAADARIDRLLAQADEELAAIDLLNERSRHNP